MRYHEKNRNKYSKSNIILSTLIAVIFCLAVFPITATAHPPGSVTLSYNLDTQTLTVTVVHETGSPKLHYVKKIDITKNGKSVESKSYDNQPDPSGFRYTYKVPATVGDTLEVTASCNIYGSKQATLIVKKLAT